MKYIKMKTTKLRNAGALGVALGLAFAVGSFSIPADAALLVWHDGNDLDADGAAEGAGETGQGGGTVQTWENKAPGGANPATQGGGGNQPTFTTTGIGGLSHPTFDGSDDWMQSAFAWNTAFSAAGDPFNSFIVFRSSGTSNAFDIMWSDAGAPQNQVNMHGTSGGSQVPGSIRGRINGGSQNTIASSVADGAGHVAMMGNANGAAGPGIFVVDGSITVPGGISIGANLAGGGIGLRLAGLDGSGGNNFSGDIAEFILFDSALTPDEQTGLQSLIGQKWGFATIGATSAQEAAANALFAGSGGTNIYIPEPSALALAGLGFLTLLRRRRTV